MIHLTDIKIHAASEHTLSQLHLCQSCSQLSTSSYLLPYLQYVRILLGASPRLLRLVVVAAIAAALLHLALMLRLLGLLAARALLRGAARRLGRVVEDREEGGHDQSQVATSAAGAP